MTSKTESSWALVGANTASPTGWLALYVELAGSLATCWRNGLLIALPKPIE